MRRLSSRPDQIKSHYTVVVVGSGYGGAIAASRMARAGQSVCVLERGKEYLPGEYPDTQPKVVEEAQFDTPEQHIGSRTGLYDLRFNDDINVFLGCGLGGTSLVNANVSLAPDDRVFADPRWPTELRSQLATELKRGFERAEEMLRPTRYPAAGFPPLKKTQALRQSAQDMGANFQLVPINVTFKDEKANHVGVPQTACKLCGDCVTGCNHGAKNTVLMNYLPDAKNHGAEIFTQVAVRYIERSGGKWRVYFQLLESGREAFDAPDMFLTADVVFLGAGALGSTEILLRSKEKGLALSSQVGARFSGNGDFLGFSYNSDQAIDGIGFGQHAVEGRDPVGPTITAAIDLRNTADVDDGMIIEEGAIPGALADFLPAGLSAASTLFGKDTDSGDELSEGQREWESAWRGPYRGATKNTQTYLVMAHDDGEGRMVLEKDRLRIRWPGVGAQPLFKTSSSKLHAATGALGGKYVRNPGWSKLTDHNLMTVHPLGGCVMAETAEEGVVNHKGQVFSSGAGDEVHTSFYVCDGSIVPRPLGVNPLLTISALAERCSALAANDRGWAIDFKLPSVAVGPPAEPQKVGVRFTETMRGYFSAEVKDDDFELGARKGKDAGSSFTFILTIAAEDAEEMLTSPEHESRSVGSVIAPTLSAQPLTVSEGKFNLFVQLPDDEKVREMRYRFKLTSREGKTYYLYGFKTIRNDPGLDTWKDTTTLYITLYDGDSMESPILGRGILEIKPEDFMRQMTTMQAVNAKNPEEAIKVIASVGKFFGDAIFEIYGGVTARPSRLNASPTPRTKRPLRMDAPELHPFITLDDTLLRLTRYQGGRKGPVILSPGFGTSTLAFTVDTVDTNLPEFLFAQGYDVWLFDYRASPALASASTQFTLDDIATKDYPAAVNKVREVSGADTVQTIVHCIGSMTFLMAMLAGLKGVRSAVCSALSFYPITTPLNELKAGLKLGNLVTLLGLETLTTEFDPDKWQDQLGDAILKHSPTDKWSKNPVERRIQMMYGEVYKQEQLNEATRRAIPEMFGVANLTTFNQIAMLVRKGKILNNKGKDVYLPHLERLALPVTFVHGAENNLFLPEGTLKTLKTLAAHNDAKHYAHIMFPNYAHMDLFVGKDAAKDIYPTIVAELERWN